MFSGNYKYFTIICWTLSAIMMYYYLQNGGTWSEFATNTAKLAMVVAKAL